MAWDDARRAQAIEEYKAGNPTGENSMDIVSDIADKMGESINGVRMILSKAGVYITKEPAKKAATGGTSGGASGATGGTRVSKGASHAALTAAIVAAGKTPDEEIISKLTGKAAVYFTSLFAAA